MPHAAHEWFDVGRGATTVYNGTPCPAEAPPRNPYRGQTVPVRQVIKRPSCQHRDPGACPRELYDFSVFVSVCDCHDPPHYVEVADLLPTVVTEGARRGVRVMHLEPGEKLLLDD